MSGDKEALLEGRFGVVGMIVVISLMSWNVYTTNSLQIKLAVNNEKLEGLKVSLSAAVRDRYTGAEAAMDKALINSRVDHIESRVSNLEEHIGKSDH